MKREHVFWMCRTDYDVSEALADADKTHSKVKHMVPMPGDDSVLLIVGTRKVTR